MYARKYVGRGVDFPKSAKTSGQPIAVISGIFSSDLIIIHSINEEHEAWIHHVRKCVNSQPVDRLSWN